MAMGRQQSRQESLFVMTADLAQSAGHPFYRQLNRLLAEADFDRWLEQRCEPYYAGAHQAGRKSIPPGRYFRMLLVGYFEGIDSQRGIAWRCGDSLSLREFLNLNPYEATPDHSTLTNTRKRLPPELFDEVFQFVLRMAQAKRLVEGTTVGVDSTTLEANAAMKSIVRRDTGEDWRAYVTRLMQEEGVIDAESKPTDEDLRRFDRRRTGKKVSNEQWASSTDEDAKIARMKDGRTHLAYTSEHVVDLASDLILAAAVRGADEGDASALVDRVMEAQANLQAAGSDAQITEVAADKGYHSGETLALSAALQLRTYIPQPRHAHDRDWRNKPPEWQRAVENNRRRMQRAKGKRLGRLRSERVERSFAHVCDTGGARRSWLRGLVEVTKRYVLAAAAHNLGRILFKLFGVGKPKARQGLREIAVFAQLVSWLMQGSLEALARRFDAWWMSIEPQVIGARHGMPNA